MLTHEANGSAEHLLLKAVSPVYLPGGEVPIRKRVVFGGVLSPRVTPELAQRLTKFAATGRGWRPLGDC